MGIEYKSLSSEVREKMIEEIDSDVASSTIYTSPRIKQGMDSVWVDLIKEAAQNHNDDWLVSQIKAKSLLVMKEPRQNKTGTTMVRVPSNAPEVLAEGEFNRYYMRGLCAKVLEEDKSGEVEIYRGKQVTNARSASQAKVGTRVAAQTLLNDLRASKGVDTALGLPPGPNSGLTAKRIGD